MVPASGRQSEVMSYDAMPPSPGAVSPCPAGGFASKDPSAIKQKMDRQRQLALERRRMAGRMAGGMGGGMAQANQLPAPAASGVLAKAPGWERVLCDGIDKPGSLAEKAEAAFADAKRTNLIVTKPAGQLQSPDEKVDSFSDKHGDLALEMNRNSLVPAEDQSARSSRKLKTPQKQEDVQEIEVSECLDFELPSIDPSMRPPKVGGVFSRPDDVDASKGWSLQLEDNSSAYKDVIPSQGAQDANGAGRRWYKPSTWTRRNSTDSKGAKGPDGAPVTPVANTDVQRMGLRDPDRDDDEAPTFHGAGRRPRRRRDLAPEQTTPAVDMDFGVMECPGAIMDNAAPVSPKPAKAQTNRKHHDGSAERAAFPQEERAAQRKKEAERAKDEAEEKKNKPSARMAELIESKKAAIGNEDFLMAQQIKGEIDALQIKEAKIVELNSAKKAAIGNEDFLEAQRIKAEIDALQEQSAAPAPAPAPTNAVQSFSSPSRGLPDDDVAAAMAMDQPIGLSDKSNQNSRARDRGDDRQAAVGSGWNMEIDEPQPAPSTQDAPVRKRFWKPFGGGNKNKSPTPEPPPVTAETSEICAFDSS